MQRIKRFGVVVMAAAALAIGAGTARAEAGSTTTYDKQTELTPEQLREVTITVKKVDTNKHKVTFEAQVAPEAPVMREGRTLKIDQLREGDEVRAMFDPRTREVVRVQVTRPAR